MERKPQKPQNTQDTKPRAKRRTEPKPPKKISERYLYNSGLYYLKRYTASTAHFKRVMMRKINRSLKHHGEPDMEDCKNWLDQTAEKLIEQGFLNDNQYAFGMVNSYRKRGLSKRAIFARLGQKGVPQDLIAESLEKIDTSHTDNHQNPEFIAALTHARKKRLGPFSRNQTPDDKERNRALGSFARAGFGFDMAKKIMDMKDVPDYSDGI